MAGRKSRQKGKRGELEAAAELRRILGCRARRGRQFSGSADSPDVVTDISGLHFEVKRTESLNLYEALRQARRDGGGSYPVVLHKRNRHKWVAVCELDDMLKIAEIIYEHRRLGSGKSRTGKAD